MKNKNNSGLPSEIYIPFVESLYANRGVMYFGVVAQCVIAYAIGVESKTPVFVWFSWIFLFIGIARAVDYKFFDALAKEDLAQGLGRKWEKAERHQSFNWHRSAPKSSRRVRVCLTRPHEHRKDTKQPNNNSGQLHRLRDARHKIHLGCGELPAFEVIVKAGGSM